MAAFGWWLARFAVRVVLGWVGLIVVAGGPLPRWVWAELDRREEAAA